MDSYDRKINRFFMVDRLQDSTIIRDRTIENFYSDRSRIIYSSSFRRLQQKAQVFSLEPNCNVRTRLTHSLEVADLGRLLANKIGYNLLSKQRIDAEQIPVMVAIVENACLLHDIGNPPFGHFGEAAIQKWAKSELPELVNDREEIDAETIQKLNADFREFDGNPQGFRIVSKLHCERDEYSLNLTISTLLAGLKYVRMAGDLSSENKEIEKKAGFFHSEKDTVALLWEKMGMQTNRRYPLTYIMEAADDIAYCLSDISDGIEKNIVRPNEFLEELRKDESASQTTELKIPKKSISKSTFPLEVAVLWSRALIDYAAKEFENRFDELCEGKTGSLIPSDSPHGVFLSALKKTSRKKLYRSKEAESIELTGYAVIHGLLQKYQQLLKLSYEDFNRIVGEEDNEHPIETRLFHHLGERYVNRYKTDVDSYKGKDHFKTHELWLRTHLIIDHISGMTDSFALETFQMLHGIDIYNL